MSTDKTIRKVRFHETGKASVLKIEEVPQKEPGENEVLIKVSAIGLNRAEVAFRAGQYLETPELPSELGYEASGIVEAIGSGVEHVKVGDKVSTIPSFSMTKYGVYGEKAIVPAHAVTSYPDNLSSEEATSIWMQYLTSYGALVEIGNLKKGQTVLLTAASSSVGIASIQIAKSVGATVIATTRTNDKKQDLLDAGADHVIVTNDEDLADRTMEITDSKGANLLFDPITGPIVNQLTKAAAQGGMVIEYGMLSSKETNFPFTDVLSKQLTIRGYVLFEITTNPERLKKARDFIFDKLASGELKPLIDKTFDFEDIVEAHEYMESNQQKGKIVVTV